MTASITLWLKESHDTDLVPVGCFLDESRLEVKKHEEVYGPCAAAG